MMIACGLASCDGVLLHLKNHPMILLMWGLGSCMPSLSWVWACLDKLPQSAPTRRIHSILSFFAHFFDWWKWDLGFGWAHLWHWAFGSSSPPCWLVWLIFHQGRRWRRKIDHHHFNLHHHHHPHLLLPLHLRSLSLSLSQLACSSSSSYHMQELCLCLMKRLLLDPSCVTFSNATILPMTMAGVMVLKSSMLWRMVMMLAYFFGHSMEMIFLTMSVTPQVFVTS